MSKALVIKGVNFINHIDFSSFQHNPEEMSLTLGQWQTQMPTLFVNKIVIPPLPLFDYRTPTVNVEGFVNYTLDFYSGKEKKFSFKNLSSSQENTLVMNYSFIKERGDYVEVTFGDLKTPTEQNRDNLRIRTFSSYSEDANLISLLGECCLQLEHSDNPVWNYTQIVGKWFYL